MRNTNFLGILALVLLHGCGGSSQPQTPSDFEYWAKAFGGGGSDIAYSISRTSDGGFAITGETSSFGAGGKDAWVIRTDTNGTIVWQNAYGGANDEVGRSIQQTSDGGFVVAGETSSFGAGGKDVWVVRLDSTGAVIWQKTYGGAADDIARSIQQTSDGGYIVAGETSSTGSGGIDSWILKLDGNGVVVWQKVIGGASDDAVYSIKELKNGGYVAVGYSKSFSSDNFSKIWALKLNASGSVVWQKNCGSIAPGKTEKGESIVESSDGSIYIAGSTPLGSAMNSAVALVHLNADGTLVSFRSCVPTNGNLVVGHSLYQTTSGDLVVAGTADFAMLAFRIKTDGTIVWQMKYGSGDHSTLSEEAFSILETADGKYVIAGYTKYFNAAGRPAIWALKARGDGTLPTNTFPTTVGVGDETSSTSVVDSTASVLSSGVVGAASNATVTQTSAAVIQQAP